MEDVLYHYCPLDTFLKIVQSEEIWLTDIFSLSDEAEHYWLRQVAKRVLSKKKESPFAELLAGFLPPKEEKTELYCCCLSQEWDSAGQWRAYADDGRGVAIGFCTEYLEQVKDLDFRYSLVEVLYDRDEQEKLVASIVDKNEPVFREMADGLPKSLHRDLADVFRKLELWQEAARCKNPWFAEEREVRLVYYDPSPKPADPRSQTKFRVGNGKLIPYCVLPLSVNDGMQPICELVFGPKNKHKHNERVARRLLAEAKCAPNRVHFRVSEGTDS